MLTIEFPFWTRRIGSKCAFVYIYRHIFIYVNGKEKLNQDKVPKAWTDCQLHSQTT